VLRRLPLPRPGPLDAGRPALCCASTRSTSPRGRMRPTAGFANPRAWRGRGADLLGTPTASAP